MKNIHFFASKLILAIFLLALPSLAQTSYLEHQRLGIPPQTINLTSRNPNREVEAFCLDRHRIIDNRYVFNHVVASNSRTVVTTGTQKYTIQSAIDAHIIKVSGQTRTQSESGLMSLRFENLTRFPVTIRILDSLGMGESPKSLNNPALVYSSLYFATFSSNTTPYCSNSANKGS